MTFTEIVERLKEIKSMGYVKTHRTGNTGIGKTLEDLIGIEENNIPGPNAAMLELKSARKNTGSMLTLFTKSPLPPRVNSVLLQKYGYESARGGNQKELHSTINADSFNILKGKTGFKIDLKTDRLNLINADYEVLCYWPKEVLKNSFDRKIPQLLYVKADFRGRGLNEEFWFNEAWVLGGFDFDNFVDLLIRKVIFVDIRIGQYPDGRTHDHGTGFRIFPDQLDLCFEKRVKVL